MGKEAVQRGLCMELSDCLGIDAGPCTPVVCRVVSSTVVLPKKLVLGEQMANCEVLIAVALSASALGFGGTFSDQSGMNSADGRPWSQTPPPQTAKIPSSRGDRSSRGRYCSTRPDPTACTRRACFRTDTWPTEPGPRPFLATIRALWRHNVLARQHQFQPRRRRHQCHLFQMGGDPGGRPRGRRDHDLDDRPMSLCPRHGCVVTDFQG